jgi:hypothetical protein
MRPPPLLPLHPVLLLLLLQAGPNAACPWHSAQTHDQIVPDCQNLLQHAVLFCTDSAASSSRVRASSASAAACCTTRWVALSCGK